MRTLLHPSAPTPSDVTQTQQPYSYHHQHHHHQQQQHYNELEVKGPLWGPTSRLRPFGLALGPSGLLDNVLYALPALRPCDPRNGAMMEQCVREIPNHRNIFCFFLQKFKKRSKAFALLFLSVCVCMFVCVSLCVCVFYLRDLASTASLELVPPPCSRPQKLTLGKHSELTLCLGSNLKQLI